jgi:hypothetical protein
LKRLLKKATLTQKEIETAREIYGKGEIPSYIENDEITNMVLMALLGVYEKRGYIDKEVFKQIRSRNIPISIDILNKFGKIYIKQMIEKENVFLYGYAKQETGGDWWVSSTVEHGDKNRDSAIVYIDGEWYEGESHGELAQEHGVKTNYAEEKESIFAHKVDSAKDGTEKTKCIYIIEPLLKGLSVQDSALLLKQHYGDYEIYSDEDGYLDFEDDFKAKYTRLAKIKKWRRWYS